MSTIRWTNGRSVLFFQDIVTLGNYWPLGLTEQSVSFDPWPIKVIWSHQRSQTFFVNNFWLGWDRDVGEVSLRSSRQDAPTDMHHDPFDPTRVTTWPWPQVKFLIDLSRSSCICFNESWRENHDGKLIPLAFVIYQNLKISIYPSIFS